MKSVLAQTILLIAIGLVPIAHTAMTGGRSSMPPLEIRVTVQTKKERPTRR